MGDPRRQRKKYTTPSHPWQKARLDEERALVRDYATKNKKEIWKMVAVLRSFTSQAKKLALATSPQEHREKEQLLAKLKRYGLLQADATADQILSLGVRDVMDRRLQTLVCRKGLANSMKQARQFITHRHILVNGVKVSSPSYMVTVEEEATIAFAPQSALFREDHAERARIVGVKKEE